MPENPYYSREADAFARVDILKQVGIWPAVKRVRMFGVTVGYQLTYDPDTPITELTPSGYHRSSLLFR